MKFLAKKKNQYLNLWDWIKISSLLLGVICGSALIYQRWNRNQQLERLKTKLTKLEQKEQEIQQYYQNQKNYQESTANLANNLAIHSFFTDLLKSLLKVKTWIFLNYR